MSPVKVCEPLVVPGALAARAEAAEAVSVRRCSRGHRWETPRWDLRADSVVLPDGNAYCLRCVLELLAGRAGTVTDVPAGG
jgi:hypothetical protein